MGRSTKSNRAARLHAIATELGVDPELVAAVGKGVRKDDDIKSAVQAHLDGQKADPATPTGEDPESNASDKPAEKKERKASLTLSQRRALLRLLDEESIQPATAFKALPFEHLVEVGYAESSQTDDTEGEASYTLTPKGKERAESINPGYRIWSAGETVAGDPNRPVAGTKRASEPEPEESPSAGDDDQSNSGESEDSAASAEIEETVAA